RRDERGPGLVHDVVPGREEPVGTVGDAVKRQELERHDLAHASHLRLTRAFKNGRHEMPEPIATFGGDRSSARWLATCRKVASYGTDHDRPAGSLRGRSRTATADVRFATPARAL